MVVHSGSVSSCRIVVWLMCSTKADESFADESVVPLKGFRILTSSLASWCVEEPMADTIGRLGVSSLCTFGRP